MPIIISNSKLGITIKLILNYCSAIESNQLWQTWSKQIIPPTRVLTNNSASKKSIFNPKLDAKSKGINECDILVSNKIDAQDVNN